MPTTRTLTLEERVAKRLSDAVVSDFQRDGAIVIRQLLTQAELALLREGIAANLAQPSVCAKVASRPDDPGRFFEDFCNWQHNAAYRRFIFETPLALAAQLDEGSALAGQHVIADIDGDGAGRDDIVLQWDITGATWSRPMMSVFLDQGLSCLPRQRVERTVAPTTELPGLLPTARRSRGSRGCFARSFGAARGR